MGEMRILHIGDVAGIPQILSKAQKNLGYISDVYVRARNPYDYGYDYYFPLIQPARLMFPINYFNIFNIFNKYFKEYDVYHFHSYSMYFKGIDLPIWKHWKKKIIMHYHGSDIRNLGVKKLYANYADRTLVSTPDLLKWAQGAIWLPNPILMENFAFIGVALKERKEPINIVHAPSNRQIKGTDHIIKVVNELKKEGYNINLILIERMKHNMALEYYANADIIIDWINPEYGIYGVFSIEGMAMGKPVLCCINQQYLDNYFNDLPIINSRPDNLKNNLKMLIEDPQLRRDLGKRGRDYVNKVHDSKKIAKELIELYAHQ